MKSLFLSIVVIMGLFPFWGLGQSLQLIEAKLTAHGEVGETLRTSLKIKNTAPHPIELVIIQRSLDMKADQLAYFTINNQLVKGVKASLSSKSIRLQPNEVLTSFNGFLTSDFQTGITKINYTFVNTQAEEDTLTIPAVYHVHLPNSENHIFSNEHFTLSKLYPNPATEFIVFDYKLSSDTPAAFLSVRNILGTELKKEEILHWQGEVRLSLVDLKPGVYFYTISIENQSLLTRKFMIKK